MKKFTLLLFLIPLVASAQWKEVSVDSGLTDYSKIEIRSPLHLIGVSVDTPWTASNLYFKTYVPKSSTIAGKWEVARKYDGDSISVTITNPPGFYAIRPLDALILGDSIQVIGTVKQATDSAEAKRYIKLKYGRIE